MISDRTPLLRLLAERIVEDFLREQSGANDANGLGIALTATCLTFAPFQDYAPFVADKKATGCESPSGAAMSRYCSQQAAFFMPACAPMGGPGGEPQGSPVLHRSLNPFGSVHPFESGRRFVQRTGAHTMSTQKPGATARKSPKQDNDFEALFTDAQVKKMESEYNTTWGMKRRLMLALLSNSRTDLLGRMKRPEDGEVFITMAQMILDFKNHLHAGLQLAECALQRIQALADHLDNIFSNKGKRS